MKKTVLLLLFCLSLSVATTRTYAQIKGLGTYKIGITTVDSLDQYNFREIKKGEEGAPGCLIVRKFVNDGTLIGCIPIQNLELWFYADRLYRIKCDYSNSVRDALLEKYGKPTTTKSTKSPVRCVFKLTGRTSDVYQNELTKRVWQSGKHVATLIYSVHYGSDCKPVDESLFQIADGSIHNTALECEISGISKEVDQMKQERKVKLKDF